MSNGLGVTIGVVKKTNLEEKNNLLYTVGEVITEPTVRNFEDTAYLLSKDVVFPFTCSDFADELANEYWLELTPPTATETLEGLISTETQALAGNKSIKGESAVTGKVLELKNSVNDLIAQFFNDGDIILGNGTAMGASDWFRYYDKVGTLFMRFFSNQFYFGSGGATITNNGAGNLELLGNTGLRLSVANANSGYVIYDLGKSNNSQLVGGTYNFHSFQRGFNLLGANNIDLRLINLDNEIDFTATGANNVVKGVFVNPTLTNVNQLINEFIAFQSVKGGVFINTSTPEDSAVLQADSTEQGSLPFPRMTEAQKNAISSPAVGLHVYQTDGTEGVYVNKSTGWAFAY